MVEDCFTIITLVDYGWVRVCLYDFVYINISICFCMPMHYVYARIRIQICVCISEFL